MTGGPSGPEWPASVNAGLRVAFATAFLAFTATLLLGHSRFAPTLGLTAWGATDPLTIAIWLAVDASLAVVVLRPRVVRRAVRKADEYLHGSGFEWSYTICRVALVLAIHRTHRVCVPDLQRFPLEPTLYQPVGPLVLLGSTPPPRDWLLGLDALFWITLATTFVGLLSRTSLVLCTLSLATLTAIIPSYAGGWSHGAPPVLLWAIMFFFAPPARGSVDRWLSARLGWRDAFDAAAFRRPVVLGQFVIAFVFFDAALFKLGLGKGAPGPWITSDGMRNILLLQHWVLGEPLPWPLTEVVQQPLLWRLMALGNVLAQSIPIAACFLLRRPLLRGLCGALVGLEVVGLGAVMGLWNPHWVLFMTLFVDWDALLGRLRRGGGAVTPSPDPHPPRARPPRVLAWSLAVVGLQVFVGLLHHEQRRWTYPFTAFPMYSGVCALTPLDEHLPYPLRGTTFELDTEPPLPAGSSQWLQQNYYLLAWSANDVAPAAERMCAVVEQYYATRVRAVRVYKVVSAISPFPAAEIAVVDSREVYRRDAALAVSTPWDVPSPEELVRARR